MREDGSAFIFALHKEKAGWRFAGWTRRAILERLSSGVKSVTELAEPFRMSQPSISKHLKVLENAGLVVRGRDAQWRPRAIDAAPLAGANAYFEKFRKLWEESRPWSAKVRAPHCLNPAAVRTVLPRILKRAEWIMAGVTPAELDARTKRAFSSHEFVMPAAAAMAYMLSPQQIFSEDDPHWKPHSMFYFDESTPASQWGAGGFKAPIIDGSGHDPSTPVTMIQRSARVS